MRAVVGLERRRTEVAGAGAPHPGRCAYRARDATRKHELLRSGLRGTLAPERLRPSGFWASFLIRWAGSKLTSRSGGCRIFASRTCRVISASCRATVIMGHPSWLNCCSLRLSDDHTHGDDLPLAPKRPTHHMRVCLLEVSIRIGPTGSQSTHRVQTSLMRLRHTQPARGIGTNRVQSVIFWGQLLL